MKQDIIQGKWKELKGTLKTKWAKLTDDDIGQLEGNRTYLAGKLQERYGWAKDRADKEVSEFERTVH